MEYKRYTREVQKFEQDNKEWRYSPMYRAYCELRWERCLMSEDLAHEDWNLLSALYNVSYVHKELCVPSLFSLGEAYSLLVIELEHIEMGG